MTSRTLQWSGVVGEVIPLLVRLAAWHNEFVDGVMLVDDDAELY